MVDVVEGRIALRSDGALRISQLMDTFVQVVASEIGPIVQSSENEESVLVEGDDIGMGEVVGVEVRVETDMKESSRVEMMVVEVETDSDRE